MCVPLPSLRDNHILNVMFIIPLFFFIVFPTLVWISKIVYCLLLHFLKLYINEACFIYVLHAHTLTHSLLFSHSIVFEQLVRVGACAVVYPFCYCIIFTCSCWLLFKLFTVICYYKQCFSDILMSFLVYTYKNFSLVCA